MHFFHTLGRSLCGKSTKISVDVAAAPHPQTKDFKAAVWHRPGLFLAVRVAGSEWGVVGCMVNSLRIQKSFRSLGLAPGQLPTQENSSTERVKPSCNWSGGPLVLPTETDAKRSKWLKSFRINYEPPKIGLPSWKRSSPLLGNELVVRSNGSIASMARLKKAFSNKATRGGRRVARRNDPKIHGGRAEKD
jgi:hypothetical protein